MQELSLKELQQVSLGILLDIHRFCEDHKLKYSLAYGSLIGAVRHKGFIPWDDDVDIVMPRPDFEILCKTFKSDINSLIYYGNERSAIACFARISDMTNTVFVTDSPWTSLVSGVWVDIFPLDGVEDQQIEYSKRYSVLKNRCSFAYKFRRQNHHITSEDKLWPTVRTLLNKIIGLNGILPAMIIKWIVESSRKIDYEKARFIGQVTCFDDGPIQFSKNDFSSYVDIDFEGYKLKAMVGYDHHLKQLYGNYLLLPSKEERVPKQYWIHFYWRNK